MRAYNLAVGLIFINCGFPIAIALGSFGNIEKHQGVYNSLSWLVNPVFKVGTIEVTGSHAILGIAILMIVGTALLLNSRAFSAQAVAYGTFTGIFWTSVATSSAILFSLNAEFPGLNIFASILLLASTLIFAIALVQLPTGGQKSHV